MYLYIQFKTFVIFFVQNIYANQRTNVSLRMHIRMWIFLIFLYICILNFVADLIICAFIVKFL